mmetsp:Transcript_20373/g.59507  ORF Transcript_20373/g.59507 Transcript_20373/m.59507 type:complete len:107 (+) Transcript_20373:1450-1770(+)
MVYCYPWTVLKSWRARPAVKKPTLRVLCSPKGGKNCGMRRGKGTTTIILPQESPSGHCLPMRSCGSLPRPWRKLLLQEGEKAGVVEVPFIFDSLYVFGRGEVRAAS